MFILAFLYMLTQNLIELPSGQIAFYFFLLLVVWDCMIIDSICSKIRGKN